MSTHRPSLTALLATTALIFLQSIGSAQIPTTGLVAYWPFSGNANDASGNGHHGTFTPGTPSFVRVTEPTLTADRFGNARRAYAFDGDSNAIRVPHRSALNLASNFTISLWFRTCTTGAEIEGSWFITKPPSSIVATTRLDTIAFLGYSVTVVVSASNGSILGSPYSWYPSMISSNNYGHLRCGPTSLFGNNEWHHVVYVADMDADTAAMYIDNGTYFCTEPLENDLSRADNIHDLFLGGSDMTKLFRGGNFYGALDDIRLYNRALSRAEVTALYNEGGWPNINQPSTDLSFRPRNDTVICPGDTVYFDLQHTADVVRWNTLDGVVREDTDVPAASPEETTTYVVTAYKEIAPGTCGDTLVESREITVVVVDAPRIEAQSQYPCGLGETELNVSVNGGTLPYRIEWSPATGLSDTRALNPRLEVTGNATYTLSVTDANGCRTVDSIQIWVQDEPQIEVVRLLEEDTLRSDTIYLCDNQQQLQLAALSATEDRFLRYAWLEGEGFDRRDTSRVLVEPTEDTTVYVLETRNGADCADYDTITVIRAEAPEITAGEDTRLCPDASHQLGASTNDPALVYTWTPEPSLDDPLLPQPTASPTTTTTYHLTATDTLTGCSTTDSITITIEDIRLSIVESSLDFEPLDGCQSTIIGNITLRNEGADPAELLSGMSRDSLVVLVGGRRSIPAGEEATIELRFSPQTAGNYSGDIVLHFGPCADSLVLPYTGERATSNVSATPGAYDFGRAADCEVEAKELEIVITNSGTDEATIAAPWLTAPYTVISPTLPTTLPEGENLTITIGYAPTGVGDFARTMYLPFQTGTCSDSIPVELGGDVWEPTLTTEDAPLDFGLLDGCTTEGEGVIEIENPGEEPLDIEVVLPAGITLSGGPSEVPAGGSRTLQLRYAPAGTGTLNDEALVIYGPCRDTLRVPLVGEKRGVSFAIADTLDFGEICLGSGAALRLGVLLDSEGTGNGAVVAAVFTGGDFVMDEMDRMDIGDGDGAELIDGVERSLTVLFEPTAEGQVTGTLRLRLEPCGVERTVVLRGSATSVQLGSPGLDFGTVPSSSTTTGTLSYTNTGTGTLRIEQLDESALGGTPFTVLSTTPPLPVDLAAGEKLEVSVEFAATTGQSSGSLGAVITGTCDTTVLATIRGTGESAGFVRLKLPQLAGEPGQELLLRIEVLEAAGLPSEGVGFRAEISVEPSILAVADATPWRIANDGARIIEVNGTIRPDDPVAASIPVTALLGRVEASPLEVVTLELSNPTQQISLEAENGSLEILGLCREGGVRLFDPSGEIAIKSIAPSPTQDRMTITYSLSETGEHRMILVDAGGREVMEIFTGEFIPGTFELRRSVESLPAGAYRLILDTPTLRVSRGIIIEE